MRTSLVLAAAVLLATQLPVYSQEQKTSGGPAIYKVEFTIHDGSDPAAKAGRRYTMMTDGSRKTVFRVGNRVPVATGSFQNGVNTQYTYLDVGVNIECQVQPVANKLSLHGNIDISSITSHEAASGAANPPNPTVGQTRLDLDTVVEPGKPTIVAAIDDPVTMRQFQVEATVSRIN